MVYLFSNTEKEITQQCLVTKGSTLDLHDKCGDNHREILQRERNGAHSEYNVSTQDSIAKE